MAMILFTNLVYLHVYHRQLKGISNIYYLKIEVTFLRSQYSVILDKQSNDVCEQHHSARRV
jgi:hypothetical protein